MPTRPPRAHPQGQPRPRPAKRKPSPHQSLYNTEAWKQKSKAFRQAHPYCQCEYHHGKPDAPKATCVDHTIRHGGNPALFWDERNWRALSWSCHSKATATVDGGFGNARRDSKLKVSL